MGALHDAAKNGDITGVKKYLEGGYFTKAIPVDEIDEWGNTALMYAVQRKESWMNSCVHLLTAHGANVNHKNQRGETPLLLAVESGDLDMVERVRGKIDEEVKNSLNPVWRAVEKNNLPIVKYFVEERHYFSTDKYHKSHNILQLAEGRYSADSPMWQYLVMRLGLRRDELSKAALDLGLLKELLNSGVLDLKREPFNTYKKTLVDESMRMAHLPVVKYLVEEYKLSLDQSTLTSVAISNDLPLIKYFIEDRRINPIQTFSVACSWGQMSKIKYFVEVRKLDVNDFGAEAPALLIAAQNGQLDVVKYFVEERKINVNQKGKNGIDSALRVAARDGRLPVVRYLIEEKNCFIDVEVGNDTSWLQARPDVLAYFKSLEAKQAAQVLRKQEEEKIRQQQELNENLKKFVTMQAQSASSSSASSSATRVNDIVNSLGEISLSLVIPYEEITLGKKLGQGGFGIVYQAKWQYSDVAVKKLRVSNFTEESINDFKHEASVMAKLRNLHIIQLYGICINQPYCLVMELAKNGSLHAALHSNEQMDWPRRLKIASGTAKGLAFLHNQNPVVLHRDIKSMNVLLDESFSPKLTDFGLAKIKNAVASTSSTAGGVVGTLHWMAPELFDEDNAHYTKACDIYSLAILFWELSSRKLPYDGKKAQHIIAMALQGKRETIPADCPQQFAALIVNCWKQTADDRPAIASIIQTLEQGIDTNNTSIAQSGYMSLN